MNNLTVLLTVISIWPCPVHKPPTPVHGKPSPSIVKYDMACKVLNYGADGQSSVMDCGQRGVWVREVRVGDSTLGPSKPVVAVAAPEVDE